MSMTLEQAEMVIEQIGTCPLKEVDGNAVADALPILAANLRETRKGLSMAGVDGAPDWLGFESALWKLSEKLRPLIASRKEWREGSAVLDALTSICVDRRNGKGRQNMVLMLGEFGGASTANVIGSLLNDSQVQGHAIKALIRLKDPTNRAVVEQLLPTLTGWMKSAAKKYLAINNK